MTWVTNHPRLLSTTFDVHLRLRKDRKSKVMDNLKSSKRAQPTPPISQDLNGETLPKASLFACSYTIVDYKLEHYFSLTPNQSTVNNPRSFTTKRIGCISQLEESYRWLAIGASGGACDYSRALRRLHMFFSLQLWCLWSIILVLIELLNVVVSSLTCSFFLVTSSSCA